MGESSLLLLFIKDGNLPVWVSGNQPAFLLLLVTSWSLWRLLLMVGKVSTIGVPGVEAAEP